MQIAFRMSVYQGKEDEYIQRHNPIWKELEETLLSHGVETYSIFLDQDTGDLFACAEINSKEQWDKVADTEIAQKWWKYMAPLMPTNEDNSPVSKDLQEVFHIGRS